MRELDGFLSTPLKAPPSLDLVVNSGMCVHSYSFTFLHVSVKVNMCNIVILFITIAGAVSYAYVVLLYNPLSHCLSLCQPVLYPCQSVSHLSLNYKSPALLCVWLDLTVLNVVCSNSGIHALHTCMHVTIKIIFLIYSKTRQYFSSLTFSSCCRNCVSEIHSKFGVKHLPQHVRTPNEGVMFTQFIVGVKITP